MAASITRHILKNKNRKLLLNVLKFFSSPRTGTGGVIPRRSSYSTREAKVKKILPVILLTSCMAVIQTKKCVKMHCAKLIFDLQKSTCMHLFLLKAIFSLAGFFRLMFKKKKTYIRGQSFTIEIDRIGYQLCKMLCFLQYPQKKLKIKRVFKQNNLII
jgi:hypothetical protein